MIHALLVLISSTSLPAGPAAGPVVSMAARPGRGAVAGGARARVDR